MAIIVQGTLRFPDNTPIVGASIKFVASKFIQSGVPIGASLIITTNSSGGYNQSILEGSYHIFIKQSGQELYTHLIDAHLADGIGNVAIGDPITLEEIIGTGPGDTPVYEGCSVIPAPTNFTVSGGFTTIILSWSIPAYICHAVTEIWVSTTDEFTNKALLTTTEASVYSHAIGHDATEYYWIRFRNLNGDYGNWYSATSVTGQTSQNPGEVLADLQQDVYNSTLFNALRTNINSSFYQALAPTTKLNGDSLASGDTWIDSDDNQRHVWDTSQVPPAWLAVTDQATVSAIASLVGKQETSDGVVKGFFQTTEPLYAESAFGDIWIDTSQPKPLTFTAIHRFQDADSTNSGSLSWMTTDSQNNALGLTYITAYNADAEITNILTGETDLDNAVIGGTNLVSYISGVVGTGTDNMVRIYSGSDRTTQTGMDTGDLYNETDSNGILTTYQYSGTGWVEVQGASNMAQLGDLTDGKRSIYTTEGVPVDSDAQGDLVISINDLWIPPSDLTTTDGTYAEGQIYRCTSVSPITFVKATKYHDIIDNLNASLTNAIDAKLQTYAADTAPYTDVVNIATDATVYATHQARVNDLWLCTSTAGIYVSGNYYEYTRTANGTNTSNYDYTWEVKADITASMSLLVDNKRTIYGDTTPPAGTTHSLLDNDLWIPPVDIVGPPEYFQGEMYVHDSTATPVWRVASRYSGDIASANSQFANYVTTSAYGTDQVAIQNQLDGNITTWFKDEAPTLSNVPASDWQTIDTANNDDNEKIKHIGDLYYDKVTGYAYRFAHEDNTVDGVDNPIYSWIIITDTDVTLALYNASVAQDTADEKRRIFVAKPNTVTSAYEPGDMWVMDNDADHATFSAGDLLRCETGRAKNLASNTVDAYDDDDWIAASRYTDDTAVDGVVDGTTSLINAKLGDILITEYVNTTVDTATDNMVNVYSGSDRSTQTGMSGGDLFIETDSADVTTTYRYSEVTPATTPITYVWVEIEGTTNVAKLADLTDSKRAIFSTPGIPTDTDAGTYDTVHINDLWIPPTTFTDTTVTPNITYAGGEIYRCTIVTPAIVFTKATKYHDLIETLNENLTATIDAKIQTYAQATVPYVNVLNVVTNSASYLTQEKLVGDLWLCSTTASPYTAGKYYEYTKTANGTTAANSDYTWTVTVDITADLAVLVENKRTIYGGSSTPSGTTSHPLEVNDLWIPSTTVDTYLQGEMYTWTGAIWDTASRYSADILELSNRTINVFYQPGNKDSNGVYTTPPGSAIWDITGTPATCTVLGVIDTTITTEDLCEAPIQPEINDMWAVLDDGDTLYKYDGTSWVLLSIATLANVDTQIVEQVGYCERTVTITGATNRTGEYTTKTLCEAAAVTGETFAWRDTGAFAALTDVISSTVDSNTSTIQIQATSINGLESEYSVKLDNNGNVSGFGLSSGAPGCLVNGVLDASITQAACTGTGKEWVTDSSTFLVAADTFAVTGTDETPVIPFVIRTGDVNGTCYVDGVVNAAATQAACEAIAGGSWAAPDTSVVGIQGSLVLDGTMSATTIKSGTITGDLIAGTTITGTNIDGGTITGNKISATTKIVAGTGNNVGVLSGVPASCSDGVSTTEAACIAAGAVWDDYRIYAGHATPASAPFRVKQDGTVIIEKSTSTGKMVIEGDVIKVYTTAGGVDTLRVKLGNLA